MKPIIAVDVDDVCANLIAEWLRKYNDRWNDTLTVADITEWDVDKFVKPECGKKVYHILSEPGLYDRIEPFPWALQAVTELRKLGRVIFVTSCAARSMDQKFAWLQRHGFLPFGRGSVENFIACKDKWLIAADILIDDGIHNVDAFPGAAFLVDRIHNHSLPCRRERIENLACAPERVAQLVDSKARLEKELGPLGWLGVQVSGFHLMVAAGMPF